MVAVMSTVVPTDYKGTQGTLKEQAAAFTLWMQYVNKTLTNDMRDRKYS